MSWSYRNLGRLAFTALLFVVFAALGQIPFGEAPREAYLRLSIRTTEAQIEVCRDRSQAELEALPAHMRQPRVCDRNAVPYRLHVQLDEKTVLDRVLEAGGARSDRPLVFDEQIAVEPGPAELLVTFAPIDSASDGLSAELAAALARVRRHELERSIRPQAGRITLVRLDGELVVEG